MGSSLKDLGEFPPEVCREIGYALHLAQDGKIYHKAKALKGIDAMEIVSDFNTDTYRAVYTAKIDDRLYVLHCFQKKSKSGIHTPKHEIDIIRKRLQDAARLAKELRK